jgi:acyl-CoA synthetase (AMP-forming)/AMP-acid ligase II
MWVYPEIRTLADVPRFHARHQPSKTALIFEGRTTSFLDLDKKSNSIANALLESGVAPGAVIAFLGKNSDIYVELLFGAVKAGCAFCPLNWRLVQPELAVVLDDVQPEVIFVDGEFIDLLGAPKSGDHPWPKVVHFNSLEEEGGGFAVWVAGADDVDLHVPVDEHDVALLVYTSGTTGRPKGVEISHNCLNYMRLCEHLEPGLAWKNDDIALFVMPNFHVLGTGIALQSLYNGSTLSILPAVDISRMLSVISTDMPTILVLAPVVIQMLLDHPEVSEVDFGSVRLVMYAGSPINVSLMNRALAEMKCDLMQFYGATESVGAMMLLQAHEHRQADEEKLKSCGRPLPLMEAKIIGADGMEVDAGTVGEIVVRSPAIFRGYRHNAKDTAAVKMDGWYRTGDMGCCDRDGFFYIVDRLKDMIVTGGENVYSIEVEQALATHPDVAQVAVVGIPSSQWGEAVSAFVVLKNGAVTTVEELVTHCRNRIAGYKVPKSIVIADKFPTTASGKILKRALRNVLPE